MADKMQKIAEVAEKCLRKDLNAFAPLPYQLFSPESGGLPPGSLLSGMVQGKTLIKIASNSLAGAAASSLAGAKEVKPLCFVYFAPQQLRSFELQVLTYGPAMAASLHRLAYAIPLSKPVNGPLSVVETQKIGLIATRKVGFTGDAALAARLNSNLDLLKLAGKLVVESISDQSQRLVPLIDPFCQILPRPQGSLLVLHTLPRSLTFRKTLQAAEVMQFAAGIEFLL